MFWYFAEANCQRRHGLMRRDTDSQTRLISPQKKAAIKQQPSIVMPRPLFSLLSIFFSSFFGREKSPSSSSGMKTKSRNFFLSSLRGTNDSTNRKVFTFPPRGFSSPLPFSQEKGGETKSGHFSEFRISNVLRRSATIYGQ